MAKQAQDHTIFSKSVRIPPAIYNQLVEESKAKAAGNAGTLARMLVLDRLRSADTASLAYLSATLKIYANGSAPRLSIRMSGADMDSVEQAAKLITQGNISRLVQIVLIERYDMQSGIESLREVNKEAWSQNRTETKRRTINHLCPSCGKKRKTHFDPSAQSVVTLCRFCKTRYKLYRDKTFEIAPRKTE